MISFEPGLKVGDLDPVLVPGRGIKILKCQHQKQTAHASSSCVEAVSLHTTLMQVSSFPLDHITPPPCLQMSCALVWVRDNLLMIWVGRTSSGTRRGHASSELQPAPPFINHRTRDPWPGTWDTGDICVIFTCMLPIVVYSTFQHPPLQQIDFRLYVLKTILFFDGLLAK